MKKFRPIETQSLFKASIFHTALNIIVDRFYCENEHTPFCKQFQIFGNKQQQSERIIFYIVSFGRCVEYCLQKERERESARE